MTRRALREADRAAAIARVPAAKAMATFSKAASSTTPSQANDADDTQASPAEGKEPGPGRRRWIPRAALLGALGVVTIIAPLSGAAQAGGTAKAATGGTVATAAPSAVAFAPSESSVVDALSEGGAVIETASALAADPAAEARAMTTASRSYMRDALQCPVNTEANGTLSAVMGGEAPEQLMMPVAEGSYRITSQYGYRTNPFPGMHTGTDFAGSLGTPLHAVADGVVTYSGGGRDGRSGQIVIITAEVDGQSVDFWYGHMFTDGVFVAEGDTVTAGQVIGEIGNNGNSTGPHLHFEVHTPNGETTTDPLGFLRSHGAQPASADAVCA